MGTVVLGVYEYAVNNGATKPGGVVVVVSDDRARGMAPMSGVMSYLLVICCCEPSG